ncbi:MAG: hypothetical protein ACP5NC_06865 [Nitrososphaeria archaeon]
MLHFLPHAIRQGLAVDGSINQPPQIEPPDEVVLLEFPELVLLEEVEELCVLLWVVVLVVVLTEFL